MSFNNFSNMNEKKIEILYMDDRTDVFTTDSEGIEGVKDFTFGESTLTVQLKSEKELVFPYLNIREITLEKIAMEI